MIKSINEVKSAYNGAKELGLIVQGIALIIIALLLVGLFVLLAFFPFALIWCMNTLFSGLAIPYNFWTWLAMFVLYWFCLRRSK